MKQEVSQTQRRALTPEERARRKRYLSATLVTCIVLAMIGGTMHVVELGAKRMTEMRNKATYDLKDEHSRIRAAGEDIELHEKHEHGAGTPTYTIEMADALLSGAKWAELDTMVAIPAGEFVMGVSGDRTDVEDHPRHKAATGVYKIDKYPVTNAQYARFVAATGHRPPSTWKDGKIPQGEELRPVTMVSWFDASAYAKWMGKRLPSEAEWEKAGRGTDGRRWPWGNDMQPDRLNTYYNVGSTTNVDAYPAGASPYGVMDLSGNVNEWVADDFMPYPGSDAPKDLFRGKMAKAISEKDQAMRISDLVATGGYYKVLRGGSWKGDPFSTALYHRGYAWPNYASDFFGFRCASDVVQPGKGK